MLAVLAEDIQGVENEIVGLRVLARGLVSRQIAARGTLELAALADAHSLAVSRLSQLIAAESVLAEEGGSSAFADDMLAMLDKMALDRGEAPVSEAVRADALEADPELAITTRRLVEEIAALRYMLRNVLGLALGTRALPGFIRLVDIYGSGCARLVRMLKREDSDHSRLESYLREAFDQALNEVLEEDWNC